MTEAENELEEQVQTEKTNKRYSWVFWGMVVFMAVLIFVLQESENSQISNSGNQASSETPIKTQLSEFSDDDLRNYLREATGDEYAIQTVNKDTGYIEIAFVERNFWDENDAIFRCVKQANEAMPELFKLAGVQSVKISQLTEFTDIYGKSKVEVSVAIKVEQADAIKINWLNINSINRAGLIRLASEVYIHPGIAKKIDNADIEEALAVQRLR